MTETAIDQSEFKTKNLGVLQARNSDAASILKAKEHLEGVYKSLQRQFQVWTEN